MPRADKDLVELVDMLMPLMNGARQRRKYVEHEWLLNYRSWQGWPSQGYQFPLPDNAVHYFIPHARKAIERSVKRGTKLLLPNSEIFQTLPFDGKSHENAASVHEAMRFILEKKIPVKRNVSSLLRCLQLYNFAALHTSVVIQGSEVWPYQRAVDPFNFYVFPDTACNLEEALLIFEDTIIPYQLYKSYVTEEDSLYEDIKHEDLNKPLWPYHLVERLAYRGLTNPDDFTQGSGNFRMLRESTVQGRIQTTRESLSQQNKAFVALSKVYFRVGSFWFYTVLCTNYRSESSYGYNTRVVRLDNDSTEPMYRWTTTRALPGELYTNSPADDIRVLQNLTNNAISQVEAHRETYAEPPGLFDAAAVGRMETKTFGNRRVWLIDGNPRDVYEPFPVQDTSSEGIRAWQIYKGLIDAGAGGTIAEGEPGRNMPRSGSMTGQLLDMALVDVEDDAKTVEEDILTKGLGDIYQCILRYVPDGQILKIPNKKPDLVKAYLKEDLKGNYSFTWLGALGFEGLQQRADKFLQFIGALLNQQVAPFIMAQLAQQGLKLDLANILRTWYTYGLGERGLGDIILEMTPEEIQQHQEAQQQAQVDQQAQVQTQQAKIQAGLQGDLIKARSASEKAQVDREKAKIDLMGKVLDFKAKQADLFLKSFKGDKNAV